MYHDVSVVMHKHRTRLRKALCCLFQVPLKTKSPTMKYCMCEMFTREPDAALTPGTPLVLDVR